MLETKIINTQISVFPNYFTIIYALEAIYIYFLCMLIY